MKSLQSSLSLSPHSLDTQSTLSRVLTPKGKSRRTNSDHSGAVSAQQPSSYSQSLVGSPQASFLGMLGLKGDMLDRLRTHQSRKEADITPQLAARVLKAYILPLFETESRAFGAKARSGYLGKAVSSDPAGNTVYGEIKLSIRLLEELKASQQQMEELKRELHAAKESAHSSSLELQYALQQQTTARTHLTLLLASHNEALKTEQFGALLGRNHSEHMRQLQDNLTHQEEKARLYASALQTERANSDKLKNHTVELEYSNGLLRMQNELVGERLKGLHTAIESLSGSFSMQTHAAKQLEDLVTAAEQLHGSVKKMTADLSACLLQTEGYRTDNKSLVDLRAEAIEDRSRVTRAAKEHIQTLQKRLHLLEDENIRLKQEAARDDKRYRDLSDEFTKLRTKMKQYRQRRKAFGEAEERICRHCQRVYVDSENFNWSCRTHQSEFAEGVWWCCGRQGKEASGCRINKHESKEEDEADEVAQKETAATSMQRCSSCKDYGHQAVQCPKDPNYRSRFDLIEEAVRLDKIDHMKHKQRLSSPDANLWKDFMSGKEHKTHLADSADDSEVHSEVGDPTPFAEIRKMRAGFALPSPVSSVYDDLSSGVESKLPSSPSYRLPRTAKSYQSSPKAAIPRRFP